MKIEIEIKYNYGVKCFYPVCATGKALLRLTGKKTVSARDLEDIKNMGFELILVNKEVL